MIQVLRYEGPQQYVEHYDIIDGKAQVNNPRVATVIMYLSSVKGGETVFPRTVVEDMGNSSQGVFQTTSDCAKGHKHVQAIKGLPTPEHQNNISLHFLLCLVQKRSGPSSSYVVFC